MYLIFTWCRLVAANSDVSPTIIAILAGWHGLRMDVKLYLLRTAGAKMPFGRFLLLAALPRGSHSGEIIAAAQLSLARGTTWHSCRYSILRTSGRLRCQSRKARTHLQPG